MASSSKRGPASSGKNKKVSASKARVISVRSPDALPRKGNVSVGRRKPVVEPSSDAQEAIAPRTKTTRATGRASGKRNRPAALEVTRPKSVAVPEMAEVATPPQVEELVSFETEVVVDVSAIVEEMAIVDEPLAVLAEAASLPISEIEPLPTSEETRGPQPARTAADRGAPTPAPDHVKRAVVTAVSRVISALLRRTGFRR